MKRAERGRDSRHVDESRLADNETVGGWAEVDHRHRLRRLAVS